VLVDLHIKFGAGADKFSATATAINFAFDQPVLLYVDAGAFPIVDLSSAALTSIEEVDLAGYMLDCTIAPCAAIAH
jgi:hypothetical protein